MSASAARKSLAAAQAAVKRPTEEKSKGKSPEGYIEIDATDESGRHFAGRFKYRVPTLSQIVEIGRLKAMLAAGQNLLLADTSAGALVEMMSYLEITLTHDAPGTPAWWAETDHGSKLYDVTPLRALYKEARSYEDTFHGRGKGRGRPEGDSEEPADGSGDAPDGADAVEPDVQGASHGRVVLTGDGA
jgi:hypothetical protein